MVSGRRHLVSGRCRGRTEQFVGFIRACLVKYRTARTEYFEFQRKYEKCEYENIVLLERNTLLLLHRRRGRRRGRARGSTSRAKLRRVAFWRCASASLFTNPLCKTKWSLGHRCVIGDCVVVSVFVSDRGCFRLAEVNSGQCNGMPVRTRLC